MNDFPVLILMFLVGCMGFFGFAAVVLLVAVALDQRRRAVAIVAARDAALGGGV